MNNGANWIYADLDANAEGTNSSNGYSTSKAGRLVVSLRPEIRIAVDTVFITLPPNVRRNWSFTISNSGTNALGVLWFNIFESLNGSNPGDINWLSMVPASGSVNVGNSQLITLTFDATGLKADTSYLGYILLNNNDPDRAQVVLPVLLQTVQSGATSLVGVVTNTRNERLTTIARIEIYDGASLTAVVSTDVQGNYAVYGLPASNYIARVLAEGYYPQTFFNVKVPQQAVNFKLGKLPIIHPTNLSANFYGSLVAQFGSSFRQGDVITVMDPNNVVCGLFTVRLGSTYGFVHVYGDDPTTTGIDEGAVQGDTLQFFINELPAIAAGPNPPIWTGDRTVVNVDLKWGSADVIPLNNNWNLMSFTVVPKNDSIGTVFNSITGKYRIVTSFDYSWGGARTFDPTLPEFSDLINVDPLHGYWVKMNQADTAIVAGDRFHSDHQLPLEQGWNLTSYLPEYGMRVENALASITGYYSVVNGFNNGALTYVPGSQFNDLVNMSNGFGFWIKTTQPCILSYLGGSQMDLIKGDKSPLFASEEGAQGVTPTAWWTDYYGKIMINGQMLIVGEKIEAYDPNGAICGEFVIRNSGVYGFMHVYGDDPLTPNIDEGAKAGDVISFKYKGTLIGKTSTTSSNWTGDRSIVEFDINAVTSVDEEQQPLSFVLHQNYPNPFNPTTQIRYEMPKDAFITLKIFDLLGREVRTLVSTEQKAGFHLVIWDGKNNQGNDVSGGAYIYRFVAGEYTKTMKLLLLK
jgi:hypothetical protein